jgi:hypothetical protein
MSESEDEIQIGTIATSDAPTRWPRIEVAPWSTTACPKSEEMP